MHMSLDRRCLERTFNPKGRPQRRPQAIRHGVTFTTPDKLNISARIYQLCHLYRVCVCVYVCFQDLQHTTTTTTTAKAIQLNRPQRRKVSENET